MRVDSGQFLFHHELMNEIVEESQRFANPIWQRYEKTAGLGDTSLPLSTMVSVPPRDFEGEMNRKKPKTCKCCYVMIASRNLSCDQSGCFCRRRLVYLSLYLHSSKWACSTLEGWKISACSHLLCSPFSIFNWSKCRRLCNFFSYMYTV